MTKIEFLDELRNKLTGLTKTDVDERLNFYSEMIDDLIEDGNLESEAIKKVGSVQEIANQILSEVCVEKNEKSVDNTNKSKKLKGVVITLLAIGSPVWVALLVSALAVIISVYASIWSAVISLWAGVVASVGVALYGIIAGTVYAISANLATGIAMVGAGLISVGLAILIFVLSKLLTKLVLIASKKLFLFAKKCLRKKETV